MAKPYDRVLLLDPSRTGVFALFELHILPWTFALALAFMTPVSSSSTLLLVAIPYPFLLVRFSCLPLLPIPSFSFAGKVATEVKKVQR